jgi:hypothetical protein
MRPHRLGPLRAREFRLLVAAIGPETFGVLWETAMQQEVPHDHLSRVSFCDALGSWALIRPLAVEPVLEAAS